MMPTVDLSFAQDPNSLALSIIYGMLPAIAWLFFWLRENRERPRRMGLIMGFFFAGVFMVMLTLPVERFFLQFTHDSASITLLWAGVEEVLKFLAFLGIILGVSKAIRVPVDYAVYAMVVALGFAGFENALYFLEPLKAQSTGILVLSGTMRFLGTTLMHAAAASLPGIALGLVFYRPLYLKISAALFGLVAAIALHYSFNTYIVESAGTQFFEVFGMLWLVTIVILVIFERLRRMSTATFDRTEKVNTFAELEASFAAALAERGMQATDTTALLVPTVPGQKPVETAASEFIAELRTHYAGYLVVQGARPESAQETARSVISDLITPVAIVSVLTMLKAREVPAESAPAEAIAGDTAAE